MPKYQQLSLFPTLKMYEPPKKMPLPYEPKRQNRWVVTFPSEFGIQSWVATSTQRPNITITDGQLSFDNISIVLRDPIGPSTTQALWNLIVGVTDITPDAGTNREGIEKSIKNSLSKFKKGFEYMLELLDPTGVTVEKWLIEGKILRMDFGPLNYETDAMVQCTVSVKPEKIRLLY